MQPYKNLSGISGVKAFAMDEKAIQIRFMNGAIYRYTHASSGEMEVLRMKTLARRGFGLNRFINQHVRKNYAARLH